MPSDLHELLCRKGLSWLKNNGFSVAAVNLWAAGSRERLDCIGFRHQSSALIEVKVSRSDFFADMHKPERKRGGGVGTYRFYLAPAGLLLLSDLPPGWGLLEWSGRGLVKTFGPTGNLWPAFEDVTAAGGDWSNFAHYSCPLLERSLLFALARKV